MLARQSQFMANVAHGDNVLAAADSAVTEINSLLIEAQALASQNVSNLTSAAEREADAELIAAIRQQLQLVGNRQFDGRFLFAGRDTTERPFIEILSGVAYTGDTGDLLTRVSDDQQVVINVPGNLLFGALSSRIESGADLSPLLTEQTRLEDLAGPGSQGVWIGRLVFNEAGGVGVYTVSLEGADTIGDVIELINEAAAGAGSTLTASLSDEGLNITPGNTAVTITDQSSGAVAGSLGIRTRSATTDVIEGTSLGARLTRLTPVTDMAFGAGIDLDSGIIMTNGTRSVTLDFSTAETVQDIINEINNGGVAVRARINEAGTGIDVFNLVSGTSLTIGENGGTTANDLGIRSLNPETPLSRLNAGLGLQSVLGENDILITTKAGDEIFVNLDDARTIGDVIDLINTAATDAAVALVADLSDTGNGIRLTDNTGGTGALSVADVGLSQAATELGLIGSADPADSELIGRDSNPIRTVGIFTALIDLETALRNDDTLAISRAAALIDPQIEDVTRMHGILGAKAKAIQEKLAQMEDAGTMAEIFLSEVRDLDFAEAVTQMQSTITQLQVTMQTSGVLLNLSLMDFLR
ncbi:MAG: hypothetical protein IIC51_02740 [Planctomycetes bacterium]|nr:hypothetical protein [Planctomycetota bacterium]